MKGLNIMDINANLAKIESTSGVQALQWNRMKKPDARQILLVRTMRSDCKTRCADSAGQQPHLPSELGQSLKDFEQLSQQLLSQS